MRRISSVEALSAFRRGDGKTVAKYLRRLSQASLVANSGVSKLIAERGHGTVLRALAEALDPGSRVGQRVLKFEQRKRRKGRPPREDILSRRIDFFDALMIAEIANLDSAERRFQNRKHVSKAELLDRKRTLERVAKEHGYTVLTAQRYEKQIRALLRKRMKKRGEQN
jgi:hypothetical protein